MSKNHLSFFVFLFASLFLFSCATIKKSEYNPEPKYSAEKLKEDFSLLKKILEANHPGLYWYTSKDSLDKYFYTIYNSINDSFTETQFRNKVSWYLNKIHCGHTYVRPSSQFSKYFPFETQPQFPLAIKAWQDSLVIIANADKNDSVLKRGTIITSINGLSNRQLLDSIFEFISTDGYADNFKDQVTSFNFSNYYTNAFPLKDSISIQYIDSAGKTLTTFIKPFADTALLRRHYSPAAEREKISHKQLKQAKLQSIRRLTFDTSTNMAYMRITSFTGGALKSFFRNSFDTIKAAHIKNLVIDLRENGGGSVSSSTVLTRYLAQKPFHIADTVAAINRSFPYGRYIHPSILYQIAMRFTTHKDDDGRYHFTLLEKHQYRPFSNLHFDGNIFIIQGGYTFSAATMFVSHIKGQPNVTVVGEETGGGNYGMNAVHLPSIVLPNSKIKIVLPVYRIVLDSKRQKNGRGIQPDILIEPSPDAVKKGIDLKMQKVKELINKNNSTTR